MNSHVRFMQDINQFTALFKSSDKFSILKSDIVKPYDIWFEFQSIF